MDGDETARVGLITFGTGNAIGLEACHLAHQRVRYALYLCIGLPAALRTSSPSNTT